MFRWRSGYSLTRFSARGRICKEVLSKVTKRPQNRFEDIPDEELIARMRGGENGVEDFLINKYKNLVRKKARMLYLAGGDREDLLQEGMWGLFKAVREFRPERAASFYTFAELCITRQMYSAIASANARKHFVLNESVPLSEIKEEDGGVADDPEGLLLERENAAELRRKIDDRLSKMERQVLDLYLNGSSYLSIAKEMNITQKSVDNALQRIRNKIKDLKSTRE